MLVQLYDCTTWSLTKHLKKKLDGNYTKMLHAILNKSWNQHSTKQQLYSHLRPISEIVQIRRARHSGYCLKSKEKLISNVFVHINTPVSYIHQFCVDIGCCLEELARTMTGRDGCWERFKEIYDISTIWWWCRIIRKGNQ